jgi:hypothetical protein
MDYPRSYNHEFTFIIPDGYTAEGLENFNTKVENVTGGFVSSKYRRESTSGKDEEGLC